MPLDAGLLAVRHADAVALADLPVRPRRGADRDDAGREVARDHGPRSDHGALLNAITTKLPASGAISIRNDVGTTDVIADTAGWYG